MKRQTHPRPGKRSIPGFTFLEMVSCSGLPNCSLSTRLERSPLDRVEVTDYFAKICGGDVVLEGRHVFSAILNPHAHRVVVDRFARGKFTALVNSFQTGTDFLFRAIRKMAGIALLREHFPAGGSIRTTSRHNGLHSGLTLGVCFVR